MLGRLSLDRCETANGCKHPEITRPGHAWHTADWFTHDPCTDEAADPIFYGRSLLDENPGLSGAARKSAATPFRT